MTLAVQSQRRNRVYVRKFEHEEARRRVGEGESIRELAREYGVAYSAVWTAVTPGASERDSATRKRRETVPCSVCGGPCRPQQTVDRRARPPLCHTCAKAAMRTRYRFDEDGVLVAVQCNIRDCANGERWQSPASFARGDRGRDLREGGFHSSCRACNTRYRRAHRARKAALA